MSGSNHGVNSNLTHGKFLDGSGPAHQYMLPLTPGGGSSSIGAGGVGGHLHGNSSITPKTTTHA